MRPYLRSRGARVRQRARNPTREHVQGFGGFKRLLVHGVELTKVGALDSKLLNKLGEDACGQRRHMARPRSEIEDMNKHGSQAPKALHRA